MKTNTLLKLELHQFALGGVAMQVQEIIPLVKDMQKGIVRTNNTPIVMRHNLVELPCKEAIKPKRVHCGPISKDVLLPAITDFFQNCPAFQPAERTGEPEFGEKVEVKDNENERWKIRNYIATVKQLEYPVITMDGNTDGYSLTGFKFLRRLPATRKVTMAQTGDIYEWKEEIE